MTCSGRARVVCLLAVAGCSGGSGPTALGAFDAYHERFIAAVCARSVSCGIAPDLATCLAAQQDDLSVVTTRADIASGKIRYVDAKAASCLRYMELAYAPTPCTITAVETVDMTGIDDCDEVLAGTVADRGACFVSAECVSGYCQPSSAACAVQCCAGICAPKPMAFPPGGDCSHAMPGQDCMRGTRCVATQAMPLGRCQVPSAVVGTPCESAAQCAHSLYCAFDDVAASTGTCQPPLATGTPCNPEVYSPCDDLHAYCHPDAAVCVPLTAVGAPCGASDVCVAYARCIDGTCVAQPSAGGACQPGILVCQGDLQCSPQTNTCELPAAPAACI